LTKLGCRNGALAWASAAVAQSGRSNTVNQASLLADGSCPLAESLVPVMKLK